MEIQKAEITVEYALRMELHPMMIKMTVSFNEEMVLNMEMNNVTMEMKMMVMAAAQLV